VFDQAMKSLVLGVLTPRSPSALQAARTLCSKITARAGSAKKEWFKVVHQDIKRPRGATSVWGKDKRGVVRRKT